MSVVVRARTIARELELHLVALATRGDVLLERPREVHVALGVRVLRQRLALVTLDVGVVVAQGYRNAVHQMYLDVRTTVELPVGDQGTTPGRAWERAQAASMTWKIC